MRRCITTLAVAMTIGPSCAARAGTNWPMFIGDGDRTPEKVGRALVEHLDDAPIAWTVDHHMGVGKGLYPGHLRLSLEHGIEPFYGGASSPIVAEDTVFVTYFKPDGKMRAKVEAWRTVDDPAKYLPPWFFSVTADDILLAVDARTGKIRWEKKESGKGLNRLGHKRGHWCVSPAYDDGRVFSMGTAGWLYAYDAKTGKKLWEVLAEPGLQQLREKYLQSKKLCWEASEKSSLVVAEGVVFVPHEGLSAMDVRTGKKRWAIEDRVLSRHATPAIWRHAGREYLVVNDGVGSLRLIDPRDGKVLWVHEGLGEQIGTVNVTGDTVALNARSKASNEKKQNGLFGAFRLSTSGLTRLWTLPDKLQYRHSWTLDRGAERRVAIQDGRVFLIVGVEEDRLVVAEEKRGKIVFEQLVPGAKAPFPMEDRLLIFHDRAHTDPVQARLSGSLGIGIDGYRRFDKCDVNAVLGKAGQLTGTVHSTLVAFKNPVKRSGAVTAMPRQPHWMPECTHVLQLHDAAIQQGGREGRLLLFLTVRAGKFERIKGFADHTTQARPVIDAEGLALEDDRLSGTIKVRFRADQWAQPLAESGDSAAGEYTVDARLAESGEVGAYQGTYGVAWRRSAPLGEWPPDAPR